MKKFKIYASLGEGFGGADYVDTLEFDSRDEALDYAYQEATDIYESYEGIGGILSMEEVEEDLRESWGEEPGDDDVRECYLEEVESWIEYYVEEVKE